MRTPRPRIVVAYDFSQPSDAALAEATRMARATGAEIVLLHVFPERKTPGDWAWQGGAAQRERERERLTEALERNVDDLASLRVLARARVTTGEPAQSILDVAADENASAIFIGADAHEGFAGALLGRVALRTVREATALVFVVRRRATASPTDPVDRRRIVVGFDFSSASTAALDAAVSLARSLGGEVRIVHVIPNRHGVEPDEMTRLRTRLEELTEDARLEGVVATSTLAWGDTATALVAETEREEGSVIALGMHSRSRLARAVRGDVTEAVLRMTDSTVMVAHAGPVSVPLVALPLSRGVQS